MKRKGARPIRRLLVRASLFILAGAIINVAVAWVLMAATPSDASFDEVYVFRNEDVIDYRWPTGTPAHWPASQLNERGSVTGFRYEFASCVSETEPFERWKAFRLEVGWPTLGMFSLRYSYEFVTEAENHSQVLLRGILLPIHEIAGGATSPSPPRILPIMPLWPGFAINTIFYAGILWLSFTAPGFVRRRMRIKRSLCPACAYPVQASDVCTECGAVLRIQKP